MKSISITRLQELLTLNITAEEALQLAIELADGFYIAEELDRLGYSVRDNVYDDEDDEA
jgi:hypothetical protein